MRRPVPAHQAACWMAAILLAGCAPWQTSEPVTPASYQSSRERIPRSVGKLRRMALLWVEQGPPDACVAGAKAEAALQQAASGLREDMLTGRKGYDVIIPDALRYAAWLAPPGSQALVDDILHLPSAPDGAAPGPSLRALIERLRVDDLVDGLLIVHMQSTCSNANPAFRALMSTFTLGMHALWPDARTQEQFRHGRALVFETSTGHLVWRNEAFITATGWGRSLNPFTGRDARPDDEILLQDLETAVPKILTR